MSGPKVNDSDEWQPLMDGEHAEIGVVGHDDSPFSSGLSKNDVIGRTQQLGLLNIDNVITFRSKKGDNVGVSRILRLPGPKP